MNLLKPIKSVVRSQLVQMGGHIIDQPLPHDSIEYIDPFLLIHHWKGALLGGQRQNEVGVGPHPHRGFSPVTFVFKGNVVHRDSLGNKATVNAGGTQWMFAGRGITHSERHSKEFVENGGELEFIQFWVNVPAKHKMDPAFYQPIEAADTPLIESDKSKIWVVSGEFENAKGPAPTFTNQTLLRGELLRSGEREIAIPASYNALLYLLDGEMKVNGEQVHAKEMVVFENSEEIIDIKATFDTRYILLSGEPINEKVQSYGPYVMNNQTEIMEAMRDYQIGKMGILIEEFD